MKPQKKMIEMGNRNGDAADQNMDISDRISEAFHGLTKN